MIQPKETAGRVSRLILGGAIGMALAVVPVGAQDEGLKLTERLIKSSGDTVKSIVETKIQISKTLGVYNDLRGDAVKDRRRAYRSLVKEMENCDKRVAKVREQTAGMNGDASAYFKDRGASLEKIASEDLRKLAGDRLDDSKTRFEAVLAAGRAAGEDYQALMAKLRDQVLFLGHDLNPTAVASLEKDAGELNAQAKQLFGKIDETVTSFNEYIKSLRPE